MTASVAGFLHHRFQNLDSVRVMELGCGPRAAHQHDIAELLAPKSTKIIRTDISAEDPGAGSQDLFSLSNAFPVSYQRMDLRDRVSSYADNEKVDACLGFYVFDSIVLPGDTCYAFVDDRWFVTRFRVEALTKEGALMLEKYYEGYTPRANPQDHLVLGYKLEEIEITQQPFGDLMVQQRMNKMRGYVWMPGGVMGKIEELFDTVVSEGGVMILGDTTQEGLTNIPPYPYQPLQHGPCFKADSFITALKLLKLRGFQVELFSFREFFDDFGMPLIKGSRRLQQKIPPELVEKRYVKVPILSSQCC